MNIVPSPVKMLGKRLMSSSVSTNHAANAKLWKRLSFFVGFPAIGLCMLNAYLKHQEEAGHSRPEFIKYDYMYRREKAFPWGDGNHTFFHNKHVNALPTGYED